MPFESLVWRSRPSTGSRLIFHRYFLAWVEVTRPALGSLLEPGQTCPRPLHPTSAHTSSLSVRLQGRDRSSPSQTPSTCQVWQVLHKACCTYVLCHARPASRDSRVHRGAGRQPPVPRCPQQPAPPALPPHLPGSGPPGDFHASPAPLPTHLLDSCLRLSSSPSTGVSSRPSPAPTHRRTSRTPHCPVTLGALVFLPLLKHESEGNGSPNTINAFRGAQELTLKIVLCFPGHYKLRLPGSRCDPPWEGRHIFYWMYGSLTRIEKKLQ